MIKLLQGLLLVFGVAASTFAPAQVQTLTTTFLGGNGQAGNMFDLVATQTVTICRFDVNVSPGTWPVEVWAVTGGGSFMGQETNPASWTLLGSVMVMSTHANVPTPLDLALNRTIPAGATQGFYVTLTGGGTMNYTPGAMAFNDANLSFVPGTGNAYPFGSVFTPRTWNGRIHYVVGTTGCPLPPFQTNRPQASLAFNGVQGTASLPAVAGTCPGQTVTLALGSTLAGHPFDVGIAVAPIAPLGGGALATPGGQVVNVPLAHPSFVFLNSLAPLPNPLPFPGNLSFMFPAPPASFTGTAQMVIVDAAHPDGFQLSQASELQSLPSTTLPGPSGDDSSVRVTFGAAPLCGPGSLSFYGTAYTEMHVISNGRIQFGPPDPDFSPTPMEALSDSPSAGAWCDFSPQLGGSIIVSVPVSGSVRVEWLGVPYFNNPGLVSTFGIQVDGGSGVVQIDGIQSFPTFPFTPGAVTDMFLGLSPGSLGATDPGSTTFAPGGPNPGPGGLGMLYQFGQAGTLAAGVNVLSFLPNGSGNYNWTGSP